MDKKPLIGVNILAVVLLVLGSLSNVVGYQTVQTSQQNIIKERINQRDLLFQTICDISNNKEIQQIIVKSQMSRGIFPTSQMPVLKKNQLRQMFLIGLLLTKIIPKSRMQSIIGQYYFENKEMQKEISTVIEKNTILNAEITQLKSSDCDCENDNTAAWGFPIICTITYVLFLISFVITVGCTNTADFLIELAPSSGAIRIFIGFVIHLMGITGLISYTMFFFYLFIGMIFHCTWTYY